MKINRYIIVMMITLLSACSKQSELLNQLASNQTDNSITPAYLQTIQENNPKLFNAALSYCQSHTQKPNCSAVILQSFIGVNGTTMPTYGKGDDLLPPTLNNTTGNHS